MEAGLGADLQSFRATLRTIRRAGLCIAKGELDSAVIGISAPISSPEGDVFASLSLVIPNDRGAPQDPKAFASFVVEGARKTSEALKAMSDSRAGKTDDRARLPAALRPDTGAGTRPEDAAVLTEVLGRNSVPLPCDRRVRR